MEIGDTDSLFEKNSKAFEKYQPDLWAVLVASGEPVSKLVFDDDRAVNIDLGDVHLYHQDADIVAAEQVEAYFERPDRIGFENPTHCNVSPVSMEVLKDITEFFKDRKLDTLSGYPQVDVGYTFIFGIGMGLHIPELLEREISKRYILIESILELVLHSMRVIDWDKIFQTAEEKGITFHFVSGNDPTLAMREVEALVRLFGSTFIDGSYAYIHYDSWFIQQARTILNEKVKLFFLSGGFFEDEILMMQNTYGNLRTWPFHVVERKPYMTQDYPVFIVGSGSSVDDSIPYIKKWRDRVIVFSCGTSLGILLKNGIRPDFHVENENTRPLVNNLIGWKETYGLQDIILVASSTVVPELSGLFDKQWYYYRAALSSSTVLSGDAMPIDGADPLVSNAAFAVMVMLGFQNIYLFGADCGRLKDGAHHSQDAVYYQEDYDNYAEGESLEFIEDGFDREVPGNFGGTVMTSHTLDHSRRTLSYVQQMRGVNLANCSNGALIELARPLAPAGIKLENAPNIQKSIIARLENQMRFFEPGDFLDGIDLETDVAGCDTFAERLQEAVAESRKNDSGFWDLEERLEKLWDDNWDECKAVQKIIGGTYSSMIRLGAFGGTRIIDDEIRRDYFLFYLDRYLETCLWMVSETRTMLSEMVARKKELSEVGVTEPRLFETKPSD